MLNTCSLKRRSVRSSVGSENVHLEAHRTDVAVACDVKEVNAENVIIKANRATVVVEKIENCCNVAVATGRREEAKKIS